MTAAPEAIVAAITEAINAETGHVFQPGDALLHDMAEEAYKAAAPLIIAAERKRIREGALAVKFSLYRPAGRNQGDRLDVVPLEAIAEMTGEMP